MYTEFQMGLITLSCLYDLRLLVKWLRRFTCIVYRTVKVANYHCNKGQFFFIHAEKIAHAV